MKTLNLLLSKFSHSSVSGEKDALSHLSVDYLCKPHEKPCLLLLPANLQQCNAKQHFFFKEILFRNAKDSSCNSEYFSQRVPYSRSGNTGIGHAVKTESKRIVILESDNLKHQCNVKMNPKRIPIIAMNISEKAASPSAGK